MQMLLQLCCQLYSVACMDEHLDLAEINYNQAATCRDESIIIYFLHFYSNSFLNYVLFIILKIISIPYGKHDPGSM